MMSSSVYLGIDIGTTSAKCLAVRDDGEVLALTQHPYELTHLRQGWVEQDPEDLWRALVDIVNRCVRECVDRGYPRQAAKSLAMSTQGGTLILADRSGRPLRPAVSWMDSRPDAECRELISGAGESFWYEETGQPLTPLNTAPKILWAMRHEPCITWNDVHVSYVPDFLVRRLCGTWTIDVPSASWTTVFSSRTRAWSLEVLAILELDMVMFSVPVESGTVIGELLPDAADELGLDPGAVLVAGAFDQAAAAHGAGAVAGGRSVLSCGTAWVLYSVAGNPVLGQEHRLCICCHVSPSEWGLVLPFAGGSVYDWYHRTFGDRAGEASGESVPPVFIPHLYGGLSPDWREESRGSLLGLTMAHTWEDIRLALMRGIAFETRRNLEAGEVIAGRIGSVRMVGGAGKSDIWPQMVTDALNRPVEVSDLLESACFGAAKLAAGEDVARHWQATDSARVCTPDAESAGILDAEYDRYLRFYEALLQVYGRSAQTGKGAES